MLQFKDHSYMLFQWPLFNFNVPLNIIIGSQYTRVILHVEPVKILRDNSELTFLFM